MATAYILLGLAICIYEMRRDRGRLGWDFLSIFHATFLFSYVIPAAFIVFEPSRYSTLSGARVPIADSNGAVLLFFLICAGYLTVRFCYLKAREHGTHTSVPNASNPIRLSQLLGWMFASAAFSLAAIYVYSAEYGGLRQAITNAAAIRGGHVEATSLSFVKRFLPAASLGAFWATAALLVYPRLRRASTYALLALCVAATMVTFLLTSSRGNIVVFLMTGILVFSAYRRRISVAMICAAGALSIITILYGKLLFTSLGSYLGVGDASHVWASFEGRMDARSEASVVAQLIHEFQHPYMSLSATISADFSGNLDYRWFADIFYGLASLIPEKIFPLRAPDTVAYTNTELLTGIYDSEIPPGILAFGVHSMGLAGLFITCAIYGLVGGRIERGILRNADAAYWVPLVYVLIAVLWGFRGIQGEPRVFLHQNFVILITVSGAILARWLSARDGSRSWGPGLSGKRVLRLRR